MSLEIEKNIDKITFSDFISDEVEIEITEFHESIVFFASRENVKQIRDYLDSILDDK